MSKQVTNKRHDIDGMEMRRVVRLWLTWRLMGIHSIGGKPPLKDLLELWLRQTLGNWISIVTVKYERQWHLALKRLRNLRFHLTRLKNRILRRPPGSTKA